MNENLPENVLPYLEPLPHDRSDVNVLANIEKFKNMYGDDYVNSIIWTAEDAKQVLNELGVANSSTLFSFYQNSFDLPNAYRNEELYGLSEIRDDYKKPFWGDKYKNIETKYLLLSSPEGEFSYFYEKNTDAVYGVGWDQMDKFFQGDLEPLFNSFFDFLAWYFSDEDE